MGAARILKILVIEERKDVQAIFRTALDGIGDIRLLFADTPKLGLLALRKTPFDLLVMRGGIARRNDYALVKAVRRSPALANLAVVVVHPKCSVEEANAALNAGATSCMTEAMDPSTIRDGVLNAIRAEGQEPPRIPDAAQRPEGHPTPPVDDEEDARRLLRSGIDLLRKKQFSQSARVLLSALKRNPHLPEAMLRLADCFTGLGNPDKAGRFRHKAIFTLALQGRLADAAQAMRVPGGIPDPVLQELGNPFTLASERLAKAGRDQAAARTLDVGRAVAARSSSAPHNGTTDAAASAVPPSSGTRSTPGTPSAASQSGSVKPAAASSATPSVASSPAANSKDTAASSAVHAHPGVVQEQSETGWTEKRRHARIPLADFSLTIGRSDKVYSVVDISLGGICFKADADEFLPGQVFRFTLMDSIDVRLKKISAVVRFATHDRVGCQFLELSTRQNAGLEELIRQEQKKLEDGAEEGGEEQGISGVRRDPSGKIIIEVDW